MADRQERRGAILIATADDGTRRLKHPSGVEVTETLADQRAQRDQLLEDFQRAADAMVEFDREHPHLKTPPPAAKEVRCG